MSFNALLDDLCDIYQLQTKEVTGAYGTKPTTKKYYEGTPTFINVPCHFNKTDILNMHQSDPQNDYLYERKLNLPVDTNISAMDKVVNKMDGTVYFSGIPDNIRNHHITVGLRKAEEYL